MPAANIDDTGVLAPIASDIDLSLVYTDIAHFNVMVPTGYVGFIFTTSPTEDILLTLSISDIMDIFGMFPMDADVTYSYTTIHSGTISAVLYSLADSSKPSIIRSLSIVIERTEPIAVITPSTLQEYTEPTTFTITPPNGFDYMLVLNDTYLFNNFPEVSGATVHNLNLMRSGQITLELYKDTKITIFYFDNTYNSYYSNMHTKADDFFIKIKEPFNFTIVDYGKYISFTDQVYVPIRFNEQCSVIITVLDLERHLQDSTTVSINASLELELNISSTSIISLTANSITKKYLFKRENTRTTFGYYTVNDELYHNILNTNVFPPDSEQAG